MEKTDKVSNNQRENDIEKIKSLSVYKLVSDNFDLISDFVDVECEINDRVTQIETKHQIMGPIDKKKIKRDIDDLNKEEAELLDQLITKLDVVDGVKMIPDNKDLIKALDIVYDEKNTEDDDDDDEAENDFENERTDFSSEEEYVPNISEKIKKRLIERGILQPENNDKELQETDAQIISMDEQARLEKVRELLRSVPEDKKSSDYFDPQKKQLEILASSGIKTKKKLLGKYYDDAGRQMLGVAEIYAYFEREICENKETDLDQMRLSFEKMAKVFKLTSWQINRFEIASNKLKEIAKNIEDFWVQNKDKASGDISLEVFGYKPDGEISIKKEKFSLVCHCFNHDDFSRIHSKCNGDPDEDSANECAGFFTNYFKYNVIVIDNSLTVSDDELDETLIHEKKHLVDYLIDEAFSEASFIEDGSTNYDVVREKYFNRLIEEAKIETFAFFKEGWNLYAIYKNMIENYNFAHALTTRDEWSKLGKEYIKGKDNEFEEISWKEFKNSVVSYRRRFRDELKKGLMLLETLESAGFSRERIISLFQTVPLEKWNKHVSRLERSKYFLEETENNIKQRFDNLMIRKEELEKEIDSYKKSTSLSVRMFKYIRRDEGWQNKKELNSIKKETKYLNELLEDIKDVKMNK